MSKHAPRPPDWPADPDKTLCNVRLSQAPDGNPRSFAKTPQGVECESCIFKLLRIWQSRGNPAETFPKDRWPWEDEA